MTPFGEFSDRDLFSSSFRVNRPTATEKKPRNYDNSKTKQLAFNKAKDGTIYSLSKGATGKHYVTITTKQGSTTRFKLTGKEETNTRSAKGWFKRVHTTGKTYK